MVPAVALAIKNALRVACEFVELGSIPASLRPSSATMKKIPRTRSRQPSRTVSIIGTGSYVPERILTNADLETIVETTDEWITTRTGIRERRIAAEGEHTSHMAARAAENAMDQAGVAATEIDLIIVATVTPDTFFPFDRLPRSASAWGG